MVSGKVYVARATITTVPDRLKTFTEFETTATATGDASAISLQLAAKVAAIAEQVKDLFVVKKQLAMLDGAASSSVSTIQEGLGQINLGVGAKAGSALALAETVQVAQASSDAAFAAIFSNVVAENPSGFAEAFMQILASVDEETQIATIAFAVRVGLGQALAEAGFKLQAGSFPGGLLSRVVLKGNQVFIENPSTGVVLDLLMLGAAGAAVDVPIAAGVIKADMTSRRLLYRTVVTGDAELQFPDNPIPGIPYRHVLMQDDAGGHTVTLASNMVGSPAISEVDKTGTVLDITVTDVDPDFATVLKVGEYTLDPSFAVRGTFNVDTNAAMATITPVGGVGTAQGQAGEIMVIGTTVYKATANPSFVPPFGWNIINSEVGLGNLGLALMWKRLDGTETSPLSLWADAGSRMSIHALRLRGGLTISYGATVEGGDMRENNGGSINLTNQTIDLSPLAAPVIGLGLYCDVNVDHAKTFSPTEDATLVSNGSNWFSQLRYKITNAGTPSDIAMDLSGSLGGGVYHAGGLIGGYLKG